MNKQCFIKSSDQNTIETLIKLGFQQLSKDGAVVTFINNGAICFDKKDLKITFSNALSI